MLSLSSVQRSAEKLFKLINILRFTWNNLFYNCNTDSDQDPREWNETFDQIFNTTIDHLETVFGGVSVPSEHYILFMYCLSHCVISGLCDVREIISTLGLVYPAMFREPKPGIVRPLPRARVKQKLWSCFFSKCVGSAERVCSSCQDSWIEPVGPEDDR